MIEHNAQWIEPWPNGWDRTGVTYTVQEYPRGWRGVWHTFKAALFPRRYDMPRSPQTYTLSLYIKPSENYEDRYIWGMQLEERHDAKSRI